MHLQLYIHPRALQPGQEFTAVLTQAGTEKIIGQRTHTVHTEVVDVGVVRYRYEYLTKERSSDSTARHRPYALVK